MNKTTRNEQRKMILSMYLKNLRDAIDATKEIENKNKGEVMNNNQTTKAHRELSLIIVDRLNGTEKEIKINTNLSLDEIVKSIDANLFNEGISKDLLYQFQNKVKNFVEKFQDNIDLFPLLKEVAESLAEAQKINDENLFMIQKMKKDIKEKFGIDYNNNESEGLNNG